MQNKKKYTPSPLTLAVVISISTIYLILTMVFDCTVFEAVEIIGGIALIAGMGAVFFSILLAYDKWRNS